MSSLEFPDEPWIPNTTSQRSEKHCVLPADEPEFTCDAKVLAAPHQRITLAGFGCGWDPRGIEVLLFAPCNPHQPKINRKKSSKPETDRGARGYLPRHTRAYSLLTILGPTFVSLRGARPHPPGPNALLRMRRYLISGRYIRPSVGHIRVGPRSRGWHERQYLV